jgi:hypothetical protein
VYDAEKGALPAAADVQAAATQTAKQDAAKAQTGADSGGTATASTLTDLVPLFDALGLLGNNGENDGTLVLNLNFLVPVQPADRNTQLSLVVNTSPEPLTQLVDAFPDTVRAARKDTLQKDISTFGDTRADLTWSLVNRRFGRDFTVARSELAPIYEGARAHAVAMADQSALQRQSDLLKRLSRDPVATAQGVTAGTPFNAYPPEAAALRAELTQAAIDAGTQIGIANRATQEELTHSGVSYLAALVEAQPQLLFSLSHDIRDSITGPESTSAQLTWEFTSANLGNFLSREGAVCRNRDKVREGGTEYVQCAEALSRYVTANGVALENQARWKLSAAYRRVSAAHYRFPDDNVTLDLPKTERIEVSLGWGRPLLSAKNADRLDLEGSYDSNINNDTSNKERLKLTLTYTRRIGEMDVPFAIVYANKNEFLGEVDHQISLHFGLKFRPPPPATK